MTSGRILIAEPLTPAAFARFGDVIQETGADSYPINGGTTLRFNDLALIDVGSEGKALFSFFRALVAVRTPYRVPLLECHPLGSQAFMPREKARFLVVVAPPGDVPDFGRLAVFVTDGEQGVNYRAGVWHMPLSSFIVASYVIIDRSGPGDNLREYDVSDRQIMISL